MKLSLTGSLFTDKSKSAIDKNHHVEKDYQTPRKNSLLRFTNQQSSSTLPRTNSAGHKTFIKRVNKMKNNQQLTNKSSIIKQIQSNQQKSHISPLLVKNCFQKGNNRPLKTVDSLKKINLHNSNKKYSTGQIVGKKSIQKKKDLQVRQIQTSRTNSINKFNQCSTKSLHHSTNKSNPNTTILPTNYTSVKLFMSTKFKKGIKQKIPVNILAHAESIHEKQTQSQLSLSQISYRNLINSSKNNRVIETVMLTSKETNIIV